MQILTIEDSEFNALLAAWKAGMTGKGNPLQIVCGTAHFLLAINNAAGEKMLITTRAADDETTRMMIANLAAEETL